MNKPTPIIVTLPLQVFFGIVTIFYDKQPQLLHLVLTTKLREKGEIFLIAAANDPISPKNGEFRI